MNIKILFLLLCSVSSLTLTTVAPENKPEEVWLTVFIHGIIRPILTFGDLLRVIANNTENTRYKFATKHIRSQPFGYEAQAMQRIGLVPVWGNEEESAGSKALAAIYQYAFEHLPNAQKNNLYYTFGWSGLLSYESRLKAAHFLYKKLHRLTSTLRDKGLIPKIRIVGFSHGGNVAYKLAHYESWNPNKVQLFIDEFITIGSPLHKETDVLTKSPMFKKIYHFYSQGDIAQKSDYFSTDYGTSHRRFIPRHCFCIPNKITQVEITLSKTVELERPVFSKITTRKKQYWPGHTELWTFGWVPRRYRNQLPINPLPTVALLPYIITAIEATPNIGNNLAVDIYPDKELLTITDRVWKNHKTKKIIEKDWIPKEEMQQLFKLAWQHMPQEHTREREKEINLAAMKYGTEQLSRVRHCKKTICSKKVCKHVRVA